MLSYYLHAHACLQLQLPSVRGQRGGERHFFLRPKHLKTRFKNSTPQKSHVDQPFRAFEEYVHCLGCKQQLTVGWNGREGSSLSDNDILD